MKIFLPILAVISGVLLLLPGLCTLGFGAFFTLGALRYPDQTLGLFIGMIIGGGLLAWLGWKLMTWNGD